jgi:hypothetical protein
MSQEALSKNYCQPNTLNGVNFRATVANNKLTLVHTRENNWDTYFIWGEIPVGKSKFLTIRQVNTNFGTKKFFTGIANANVAGISIPWRSLNQVSFESVDGRLTKNNGFTNPGVVVADNTLIKVQADLTQWKVFWYANDNLIVTTSIPDSLKGNPIYFYVAMYDNGITGEIIL